jgi:tRNA(Ile2) C34 agmatinyltransferase TiaS
MKRMDDDELVCFNCGCPPPSKGEIGIYCSACGAQVHYITNKEFEDEHPSQ